MNFPYIYSFGWVLSSAMRSKSAIWWWTGLGLFLASHCTEKYFFDWRLLHQQLILSSSQGKKQIIWMVIVCKHISFLDMWTIYFGEGSGFKRTSIHIRWFQNLLTLPDCTLLIPLCHMTSQTPPFPWNAIIFIFRKTSVGSLNFHRLQFVSLSCLSFWMISFIIQLPKDNACYLNWLLRQVWREEKEEDDRWLWRKLGTVTAEEIRNAQGTNWREVFQWKWILVENAGISCPILSRFIAYNALLVIYKSPSKQHYMVKKKKKAMYCWLSMTKDQFLPRLWWDPATIWSLGLWLSFNPEFQKLSSRCYGLALSFLPGVLN